jgi:hypothetical protein
MLYATITSRLILRIRQARTTEFRESHDSQIDTELDILEEIQAELDYVMNVPSDKRLLEASDARFAYCEAMHRKGRASLEGFLQATREELSNLVYGGGSQH